VTGALLQFCEECGTELSSVNEKRVMPTISQAVAVNMVASKREMDALGEWRRVMNCHE
jgi:hypothetical protein